jgi:hypothetical protein
MCLFFVTQTVVVYATAYAYDTIHMHEVMMYGKDFVELLNMMNLLIEQVTKHCDLATGRGRGGDGDGGCGDGAGMGTADAGTGWGWGRRLRGRGRRLRGRMGMGTKVNPYAGLFL